jgi:uridine kinase
MSKISKIIDDIKQLSSQKNVVLVAIDGNGGSGKTTLSKIIKKSIPNINIIRRDLYPSPYSKDKSFDAKYLRKELLLPLKQRINVSPQIYHWPKKEFVQGGEIVSKGVIILEGTLSMHEDIVDLYDYTIWVECPSEIGMKRALKRDSDAHKDKWINEWVPRMKKYINTQKPAKKANTVIDYKEIPKED